MNTMTKRAASVFIVWLVIIAFMAMIAALRGGGMIMDFHYLYCKKQKQYLKADTSIRRTVRTRVAKF